jgi:pimeloyl-ACP methyl ester carboxylesterase
LILTPACGGDITSVGPQRTSGASPSPQASPSPAPSSEEEGEEVAFSAEDGTELIGRLWRDGDVGVVLAHGFSELTGQDDWLPWPGILSEEGYTVLTFNFRGFCSEGGCSGGGIQLGNNWKDVLAAMDFLSSQGAERVFLVGASMGGIAVMRAARDPRVEVAGIVSLSTPQFPAQYYSGSRGRTTSPPAGFERSTSRSSSWPGTATRNSCWEARSSGSRRRLSACSRQPRNRRISSSWIHTPVARSW